MPALSAWDAVELEGTWLVLRAAPEGSHRVRTVTPDAELLRGFVRLADAPAVRIRDFARHWGLLRLCEHWLPASHNAVQQVGAHLAGSTRWCQPMYDAESVREPVGAWRHYARVARSVLNIATQLAEGHPGAIEDWRTVFEWDELLTVRWRPPDEDVWPYDEVALSDGSTVRFPRDIPPALPLSQYPDLGRMALDVETGLVDWNATLAVQSTRDPDRIWNYTPERTDGYDEGRRSVRERDGDRATLAAEINRWLWLGNVRPVVRWSDAEGIRLEFGQAPNWGHEREGTLFGSLALTLMLAVSRSRGLAFCSECGNVYVPRRVQSGRKHYCDSCRATGAPGRNAARWLRERKKRGAHRPM